jgi:hypothetical protein
LIVKWCVDNEREIKMFTEGYFSMTHVKIPDNNIIEEEK